MAWLRRPPFHSRLTLRNVPACELCYRQRWWWWWWFWQRWWSCRWGWSWFLYDGGNSMMLMKECHWIWLVCSWTKVLHVINVVLKIMLMVIVVMVMAVMVNIMDGVKCPSGFAGILFPYHRNSLCKKIWFFADFTILKNKMVPTDILKDHSSGYFGWNWKIGKLE